MGIEVRRLLQASGFVLLAACSSTSVNSKENGSGGSGGAGKGGAGTGGVATGGKSGGGGTGASGGASGGSAGVPSSGGSAGLGVAGAGGGTFNLGNAIQWNGACSTNGIPANALGFGGSGQPFTVEFWYRVDVPLGTSQRLISMGATTGTDPGWGVQLAMSGQFEFCTSDGASRLCAPSGSTLASGELYHLAAVHAGAGQDSVFVLHAPESMHVSTPENNLPAPWTPGVNFDISDCSANTAHGTMDALMIWAEARTPVQLDADAYANQPCSGSTLTASFNFDDLSAKKIVDCASSGIYENIGGTNFTQIDSPFD